MPLLETEQFDNYLNETNEIVTIAGYEYQPAQVLKETDPVAYRCLLADYESEIESC